MGGEGKTGACSAGAQGAGVQRVGRGALLLWRPRHRSPTRTSAASIGRRRPRGAGRSRPSLRVSRWPSPWDAPAQERRHAPAEARDEPRPVLTTERGFASLHPWAWEDSNFRPHAFLAFRKNPFLGRARTRSDRIFIARRPLSHRGLTGKLGPRRATVDERRCPARGLPRRAHPAFRRGDSSRLLRERAGGPGGGPMRPPLQRDPHGRGGDGRPTSSRMKLANSGGSFCHEQTQAHHPRRSPPYTLHPERQNASPDGPQEGPSRLDRTREPSDMNATVRRAAKARTAAPSQPARGSTSASSRSPSFSRSTSRS